MAGHTLQGVRVYKNDEHLLERMKKMNVSVLLVSPLKRDRLVENQEFVNSLLDAGINIYFNDIAQKWDGKSDLNASQLREVQIEDLLPRDEIQVDLKAVEDLLRDKVILITGSAGSIGSEMVRQISKFKPARMVLVDEAETPQHDIRLMMARNYPGVPAETIVTSNYMAPGAGPVKDVTHYYYSGDFDENLGNVYYTPYFISRKYNVGARDFYEEFLFDKGDLVFYFSKSENDEIRYYWGPDGFFHEVIKGKKTMDEVFANRLAHDLKDAFDKLMNREF